MSSASKSEACSGGAIGCGANEESGRLPITGCGGLSTDEDAVGASGHVDLIDFELGNDPAQVKRVRESTRAHGTRLVLSYHNFGYTPGREFLVQRFLEAERQGAFARLAPYRDSAINAAKFSGEGPWERHQNGDEIVQVVDGATMFHIMTDNGPQSFALKAGMVVIVPQGKWHRFEAPDGVSLVTTTPQPTEHLTFAIDDPRTLE